jgi:hypothetical protein
MSDSRIQWQSPGLTPTVSDSDFPDLYSDGVQVASGTYGLSLTFYLSDPDAASKGPGEVVARVRVSAPLGEALADVLKTAIANQSKSRPSRASGAG